MESFPGMTCMVFILTAVEANIQHGPVLRPVCPEDWSSCRNGSECTETGCCGRLNMFPLPVARCCVPKEYVSAFKPLKLCMGGPSLLEPVEPDACPPLPVPPPFDPSLGFGCPTTKTQEECKSDQDCDQSTGIAMKCCPFSVVLGCYGGKKCTSAVYIG